MVFLTGVWVTASLLKSPGLFSVFPVVLNNAVVWIVSTRPPNSKSSRPFNNPLVTVPKVPITIGVIVTFMFHSFFQFSSKVEVLLLLLLLLFHSIRVLYTSFDRCFFSLKSERQQVYSGLLVSSNYSNWSKQCCGLDGLDSSSDLQLLLLL